MRFLHRRLREGDRIKIGNNLSIINKVLSEEVNIDINGKGSIKLNYIDQNKEECSWDSIINDNDEVIYCKPYIDFNKGSLRLLEKYYVDSCGRFVIPKNDMDYSISYSVLELLEEDYVLGVYEDSFVVYSSEFDCDLVLVSSTYSRLSDTCYGGKSIKLINKSSISDLDFLVSELTKYGIGKYQESEECSLYPKASISLGVVRYGDTLVFAEVVNACN